MNTNMISRAAQGLLHLFYPRLCEGCDNELQTGEQTLCLHCAMALPRTGFHDIPDNRAFRIFIGRVPIEKATSFVFFTKDSMMQRLLHRFKYKGKKEIGAHLGVLLAWELKKSNWPDTIDIVVPVPLHAGKQRKRGYNQAAVFAAGIAAEMGKPVLPKAVLRTKHTETQTRKSRAERVENVRDVFKVKRADLVHTKRILLVDDVLTTGATLEACAIALLQAGATSVSIASIALASD